MEVQSEPFPLNELVQDVVQKYQLVAEKKSVHLLADFKADLPFVCADIGLIERVFENLIENALRHTPAGGRVAIIPQLSRESVAVQVQDTGHGIAADDLPHIFDRFYQVSKHCSNPTDGAGLGLAIAKRILELHGSAIEVDSRVNGGTTFTFRLPRYAAPG
jgi:hypothetical protein